MTTQHTPGPWNFYNDSNDGKTNRIEIVAIGKTVARIYHSVPEEDLPNARLIAAAPETAAERDKLKEINAELLNVLELCRSHMYEHASNTPDGAFDKLCSVLAKVTGEQP
jgi:hypothetical protein